MNTTTQINPEDFVLDLTPGTSIKAVMKEADAASRDLWQVPINRIHVLDGFNVRVKNDEYVAGIRELADSILVEGYYQHKPLAGYLAKVEGQQVIYLFDGHRRFEATQLAISEGAAIEFLPVVVSKDGVSLEDLTVSLVKTNIGKPLTPYETAIVCKRLVKYGHDVKGVAQRLGFTTVYVTNLLQLMAMPSEAQRKVANNEISATTVIEMFAKHGCEANKMLDDASKAAKAAGKDKITSRFVPGAVFKKTLKKTSETMFQTLTEVQADPAFDSLSEDIRNKLVKLVETLQKSKDND